MTVFNLNIASVLGLNSYRRSLLSIPRSTGKCFERFFITLSQGQKDVTSTFLKTRNFSKMGIVGTTLAAAIVAYWFFNKSSRMENQGKKSSVINSQNGGIVTIASASSIGESFNAIMKAASTKLEGDFSRKIEEGDKAILGGDLTQAENYYALALELVHFREDRPREGICLSKLGELYFNKGTKESLLQSAGMYHYALRTLGEKEQQEIKIRLINLEEKLIELCTGTDCNSQLIADQFELNRTALQSLRNKINERINLLPTDPKPEDIFPLLLDITEVMKGYIKVLCKQVKDVLGEPKSSFALVGFGSFARGEMTHYSDLEFGILIGQDNLENREYCKNFTTLLHLKVINLGETILPALNIPWIKKIHFEDSVIPRGFAFDGSGVEGKGCKIPFGNGKTFELIGTPQTLAKYQGKDEEGKLWFDREPHLPMELHEAACIDGDEGLVASYIKEMNKILAQLYGPITIREFQARTLLLEDDRERFNPYRQLSYNESGLMIASKKDLYRLPQLCLTRLALLNGVTAFNSWEKIKQLNDARIIKDQAEKDLLFLVTQANFLRLLTYSKRKAQQDSFEIGGHLDRLRNLYQRSIPFHSAFHAFTDNHEKKFAQERFFDDSPSSLGRIALRLMQFEEARVHFRKALAKDKNDSVASVNLEMIGVKTGETNKISIAILEKELEQSEKNGTSLRTIKIKINLGSAFLKQSQFDKAIKYLDGAYQEMKEAKVNKEKEFIICACNLGAYYHGKGDYDKALSFFEEAEECCKVFKKEEQMIYASILNNKGAMHIELGKITGKIEHYSSAMEYCTSAWRIDKKSFGKKHPNIVRDLNNIGIINEIIGQRDLAFSAFSLAYEIYTTIYGHENEHVARTLCNMGILFRESPEGIKYLNESLVVYRKLGPDNLKAAQVLNNLGISYTKNGDPNQAIDLLEQAYTIEEKHYEKKHLHLAGILENLGNAYCSLANISSAQESKLDAETKARTAYERSIKILGEQHPDVPKIRQKMALFSNRA